MLQQMKRVQVGTKTKKGWEWKTVGEFLTREDAVAAKIEFAKIGHKKVRVI